MNESVILRMGWNANAVKAGTMAMMSEQRKASSEFVSLWRKASAEVDRIEATRANKARSLRRQRDQERRSSHDQELKEIAERAQAEVEAARVASVRAATRSNRARALVRQRRAAKVGRFQSDLESARQASGVGMDALAKNVGERRGHGGHGLGGMNSGTLREMAVIGREVAAGNWMGAARSATVLAQSMGKLGTVLSSLVNPVVGAVVGLAAGAAAVYKLGYNARQTITRSGDVGFSTTGYQTFIRQASRESGGAQAAGSSLDTLSQNIGSLRSGDMGQMRKFRKYGIATTTANGAALSNEQIFQNVLGKFEGTGDPAKRAAMALDMFGESYKKILKTLNEGQNGMNAAMGKSVQSSGNLAMFSQVGSFIGDTSMGFWNGIKRGAGSAWNSYKNNYAGYMQAVNPGLRKLAQETERSEQLAQQERDLVAAGKIKPRRMTQKQFDTLHPELAADLKSARMHQEDLQNELADRGKVGLGDMADQGRRMSGHIRPRLYTITGRMRTAMKIDDLEARANMAFMRGDDSGMQKFRGEADAMRKANPWMAAADRDPTRKVEEQLITANKSLEEIAKMADFVMSEQ
jgi:hypothetical protein